MRFPYIFLPLFALFTVTALPFPSRHSATTDLNARNILYSRNLPIVTFSNNQYTQCANKKALAKLAQDYHAQLPAGDNLKGATYANWENGARLQYHSGHPAVGDNKIDYPFFRLPTVTIKQLEGIQNTDGLEDYIHKEYTTLGADNRYKIATHARILQGWHVLNPDDKKERALWMYHYGPGKKKAIGTPWEAFRDRPPEGSVDIRAGFGLP